MGRLPFDPGKMRGAKPPKAAEPAPAEGVLTVSRLAAMISTVVGDHLPARVRVVGEVSGARRSTHLYFGLKDAGALISAAVFASNLRKLGFEPRDGQQIVATGRVEFYEPQGRITLIVEAIEPVGQGAHELRFKQLCEELRRLGWFAAERKRPLPTFPRKVAVVTSRTGAALQDVLDTMARRCPAVGVVLVPVKVQGEGAAEQVVRALAHLAANHEKLGIDAVIVTRGGGSPEDLDAFNEREVARAIVQCPVPVVAAIGHETDTTIAELVADERCATPTQAAMRSPPTATPSTDSSTPWPTDAGPTLCARSGSNASASPPRHATPCSPTPAAPHDSPASRWDAPATGSPMPSTARSTTPSGGPNAPTALARGSSLAGSSTRPAPRPRPARSGSDAPSRPRSRPTRPASSRAPSTSNRSGPGRCSAGATPAPSGPTGASSATPRNSRSESA